MEWLERVNIGSESSASTAQDSLNKFERTIQIIVKKAPSFGERVKTASPEDRGIMTDIGTLMSKVIDKLADGMKGVEVRNRKTNFQILYNIYNIMYNMYAY